VPASVPSMRRIAVLVSGSGTNLVALLEAIAADPAFGGEVVVVVSDQPTAGGLEQARRRDLPVAAVPLADHPDRAAWEVALTATVATHAPDVVVLAGFMRVLSERFLRNWPDRVLNTHPSLLPAFRGAHAVRDALAYGVKVTGATVHLVDEQVDNGPIVAQTCVPVAPDDTEASLHTRIKAVEHELLPACVKLLCRDRLRIEGRTVHVLPEELP